jgi:hypothetical protein
MEPAFQAGMKPFGLLSWLEGNPKSKIQNPKSKI